MNVSESLIVLLIALASAAAQAKLPPPTPEEQAAAAQKKAHPQWQREQQKKSLEQAQDPVFQHYRKEKGGAPAAGGKAPETSAGNMPKTTKELPGGVGPTPTQPQSSEAHSGMAR
jgi:hypothetical protein